MIRLVDILNEFWPFSKKQQTSSQQTSQKKKPGEVWRTTGGRFGSINKSYPNYTRYFDTEEKARRYATASIKKSTGTQQEPTPAQDTTGDSSTVQAQAAARTRRREKFAKLAKGTAHDTSKDNDELELLRQLNINDEPEKDKKSYKFGGGGGFSGGGGGSSF